MPNEKPIIFSTETIQAILDERKTQTRRVIKPQPVKQHYVKTFLENGPGSVSASELTEADSEIDNLLENCPYGIPGNELWVRETWRPIAWDCENPYYKIQYKTGHEVAIHDQLYPPENPKDHDLHLRLYDELTDKECPQNEAGNFPTDEIKKRLAWKSPIFMPRGASRIQLTINDIQAERVQDIKLRDIFAEGVEPPPLDAGKKPAKLMAYHKFKKLWDSINADRGYPYKNNDWVWVIDFKTKRIQPLNS